MHCNLVSSNAIRLLLLHYHFFSVNKVVHYFLLWRRKCSQQTYNSMQKGVTTAKRLLNRFYKYHLTHLALQKVPFIIIPYIYLKFCLRASTIVQQSMTLTPNCSISEQLNSFTFYSLFQLWHHKITFCVSVQRSISNNLYIQTQLICTTTYSATFVMTVFFLCWYSCGNAYDLKCNVI